MFTRLVLISLREKANKSQGFLFTFYAFGIVFTLVLMPLQLWKTPLINSNINLYILQVAVENAGRRFNSSSLFVVNQQIKEISFLIYLNNNSQGLMPVCFLKAVEKCEMEEYPSESETSVTVNPFSYNKYLACSILWLW